MENNDNLKSKIHLKNQNEQTNVNTKKVSMDKVVITYFGGFLAAMIITWGIEGFDTELIQMAWMFPYGCMLFAFEDSYLKLGYLVYAIMFILAFIFRQKHTFMMLLLIYILILCLNIVGCHMMQNIHIS